MKKRLFLITLMLLLVLSLTACFKSDEVKDYISSEHQMLYYMPNSDEPQELDVTIRMGRATKVSLTAETVTIDEYHTYAGLYTEPVGGKCVFDANGRRMANADLPSSGVLYVQGVGASVELRSHTYTASELISFGMPATIAFGSTWPDQLPVVEKEGYTFYGWTIGLLGLITGPDGKVFEQCRRVDEKYIDRGLTVIRNQQTKEIISLRLYITPILRENTAKVTYMYNDGSYRETVSVAKRGLDIQEFDPPQTGRDGMELIGWSTEKDAYVPHTGAVTEDLTLYAIWREYRTAFVTEWRGQERIERVLQGDSLTLGTPTREGYTFGGWYDNESCLGAALAIDGSVSYGALRPHYFAKWIPNE